MQQILEIVLIAAIIVAQCYFFWITLRKIRLLQAVFGHPADYGITRVSLQRRELEKVPPHQILTNLSKYGVKVEAGADSDEIVSLGLITQQQTNPVSRAIIHSINTYLLRNSGVIPDFNLIKDIAERNSDAVEEEISSTISVPLYLGLLGTLLGIIFGLFNISNLTFADSGVSRNVMLDLTIPALLGGVKIAMIASFIGLLLTVIHSGILFKTAKAVNVRNRHDFFTFIQVELLPILNQNLNQTLYSLQTNLLSFNKEFSHNIHRLDGLMNKNYDALIAQEHVIEMLSKMDITEFATANVQTLAQLQTAIRNFGEFNQYVGSVNFAIQRTDNVIARITDLMNRTEGVEHVTQRVLSVFEMNHELMRFLKSHFSALDNSKQMISHSVVDVNEQLSTALDELRKFTAEKVTAIRNIEIQHVDHMNQALAERLKKTDDSHELMQILRRLTDNNNSHTAEMETLNSTLQDVRHAIAKLDRHIKVEVQVPSPGAIVKSWFKKEKQTDEKV